MAELINSILIFFFVFAWLVIFKNIASVLRVMAAENGKFEISNSGLMTLGCAISYIITVLIYWA